MGYVTYQLERVPSKGFVGLFVYGICFFVYGVYFTFIAAAVVAAAGFIAAALAVMFLGSIFSSGMGLWRRHVLNKPGSTRPRSGRTAPMQNTKEGQGQVVATQPIQVATASATVPSVPPEPPLTMPKRVTQAWIEANVPHMSASTFGKFTSELRKRRWSDSDIATRVIPHARVAKEIEQLRGAVETLTAQIAERR